MDTVEKRKKLEKILNLLSQEDKEKSIIEINNYSEQHKEVIDYLEKEIGQIGIIEWCYEVSYNSKPIHKIHETEGKVHLISYGDEIWHIQMWQIKRFLKVKIK